MPRPSYEEYPAWLREQHEIDLAEARYKTHYEINSTSILAEVTGHKFVAEIDGVLNGANLDYRNTSNYQLLMSGAEISFQRKPFESVINKSYRKNIAFNRKFPKEPEDGWFLPSNWYSKCNDIIRGTLVTKYIDGPSFLAQKLVTHAESCNLQAEIDTMESDSGYYAYHFYTKIPVPIVSFDLNSKEAVPLSVEIQITTQLQEILRQLTHGFYEQLRIEPNQDRRAWKWDVDSPRFQASYLGHTLHLLEGMIVQLKNRAAAQTSEGDNTNAAD
ncbi:hypothetical protein [Methylobacterium sp. Leaf86]|uniref:hypothetical protein n=1 Tax=Methylobacterium sp. Leaf86 TaxID=1736242 RepID=UPI000A55C303|nr:hypothetical protein [Methylobacterium sp. Leaf86]